MSQQHITVPSDCKFIPQLLALVFVAWAIALGLDHLDILGYSVGAFLVILFGNGLVKCLTTRETEVEDAFEPGVEPITEPMVEHMVEPMEGSEYGHNLIVELTRSWYR